MEFLKELARRTIEVFKRFPVAAGLAAILCVWINAMISPLHALPKERTEAMIRIILCLALAFLPAASLHLAAPRRRAAALLALPIAPLAWLLLRSAPDEKSWVALVFQLAISLGLLAAWWPFRRGDRAASFWLFCERALRAVLAAGLLAGILHLGIEAALLATQHLFEVRIGEKVHQHLAAVIYAIGPALLFLARLPETDELQGPVEAPRALRVLAEWFLLPILLLYFAILYVYTARIAALASWPKGTVGGLVTGVAIYGFVAYFLAWPMRETARFAWTRFFVRRFAWLLLPLLGLLALALGRRIHEYGLTEDRYLLTVLTAWMAGAAWLLARRRQGDFRGPVAALGLLGLLLSFGPWGLQRLPARVQDGQLMRKLEAGGFVQGDRLVARPALSFDERKRLTGQVTYLHEHKALDRYCAMLGVPVGTTPNRILELLGQPPAYPWEKSDLPRTIRIAASRSGGQSAYELREVRGFDYYASVGLYGPAAVALNPRSDELSLPRLAIRFRSAGELAIEILTYRAGPTGPYPPEDQLRSLVVLPLRPAIDPALRAERRDRSSVSVDGREIAALRARIDDRDAAAGEPLELEIRLDQLALREVEKDRYEIESAQLEALARRTR